MPRQQVNPLPFYDRKAELAALDRAWKRRGSGGQMMLIYGRRRLGKTFLLQRYVSGDGAGVAKPHCYELAEQTTASAQRFSLARQLLEALPVEGVTTEEIAVSWNALLRHVSQHARALPKDTERFTLILDEFPYLVEQAPELPSVLQAWWDREGVHAPIFVILCGSQLSAMAAIGESTAPLFGRFNAGIFKLEPLDYSDVASFYDASPLYGTIEKLVMFGVLGGTPRYHALVDTSRPMDEEIVALLMRKRAPLENEVSFLLGSDQIRDPAPYNAVLNAIASGETQSGRIQQLIGVDRGGLSFYLRTLQELGWIKRELPFRERSDRRAIYRVADPFLSFWYRFVFGLSSALQFSDPSLIYRNRVKPQLAQYMGWAVFEEICAQWMRRHAAEKLGLQVHELSRYWSRDGSTEIDLVAEIEGDELLFGECKWREDGAVRLSDYSNLQAKVLTLPDASWRRKPSYVLFTAGTFAPELMSLAADPESRLYLVSGKDLLPD